MENGAAGRQVSRVGSTHLTLVRYTSMSSAPVSCSLDAFLPAASNAASALSATSRHPRTSSHSASRVHAASWIPHSGSKAPGPVSA